MGNFFNKLFSVRKSKILKTYCVFGIKFQFRNYKYMIREMYRWQYQERLKNSLKIQNIALPEDATLLGEVELAKIALKDIRREWKGKIYPLKEVRKIFISLTFLNIFLQTINRLKVNWEDTFPILTGWRLL